jgi:hypothetical protein
VLLTSACTAFHSTGDAPRPDAGSEASNDGGAPSSSCGSGRKVVVALDSVAPSPQGAGGDGRTSPLISPLIWQHTTSGENRALFVGVSVGHTGDDVVNVDSVQYGDVSLKNVYIQPTRADGLGTATLWVLANPALGAHPVSVSFAGVKFADDSVTAGSISFTGVDQQTPYRNVAPKSGMGAAAVSVASAPGNMVVSVLAAGCDIGQVPSVAWLHNVNCNTEGGNGAQSTVQGAPSVDLSYSIKDSDHWALIGADVNAACSGE